MLLAKENFESYIKTLRLIITVLRKSRKHLIGYRKACDTLRAIVHHIGQSSLIAHASQVTLILTPTTQLVHTTRSKTLKSNHFKHRNIYTVITIIRPRIVQSVHKHS